MKKYLLLLFALGCMLFCSISHEVNGNPPDKPYLVQTDIGSITADVCSFELPSIIIDYGSINRHTELYSIDINTNMVEDVGFNSSYSYNINTTNNNTYKFNWESPYSFNRPDNKLILNNLIKPDKYAAISRKFLLNDNLINYIAVNSNLTDTSTNTEYFRSWLR